MSVVDHCRDLRKVSEGDARRHEMAHGLSPRMIHARSSRGYHADEQYIDSVVRRHAAVPRLSRVISKRKI